MGNSTFNTGYQLAQDIASNSQAIANLNINTISSSTSLLTLFNGMDNDTAKRFYSSTGDNFTDYPSGISKNNPFIVIEKKAAVGVMTITSLIGSGSNDRAVGYVYGTNIYWEKLALNSNVTTKAPKGTKIDIAQYYTNQEANVFEYVGISIVVPALSEFHIHVEPIFNTGAPLGSLISDSNTGIEAYQVVAKSSEGSSQCSFCGYNYANSAKTYYIWVKRNGVSENRTRVHGVIRQLEI